MNCIKKSKHLDDANWNFMYVCVYICTSICISTNESDDQREISVAIQVCPQLARSKKKRKKKNTQRHTKSNKLKCNFHNCNIDSSFIHFVLSFLHSVFSLPVATAAAAAAAGSTDAKYWLKTSDPALSARNIFLCVSLVRSVYRGFIHKVLLHTSIRVYGQNGRHTAKTVSCSVIIFCLNFF